jgi:hypothetical protein
MKNLFEYFKLLVLCVSACVTPSFFGSLSVGFLLASCAADPQSAGTQTTTATSVATASSQPVEHRQSVWVDPPTGSHVGGGFVRTGGNAGSDDEPGLISAIDSINRAATSQREQPYAISAVAFVNGVSESQLLAQQHQTQLRLGELLALRTIARNKPSKVKELASLKSQGKRWADLAQANGMTVAMVAKVVRRANDLTVESYLGNLEKPGAPNIIRGLGVAPQGRPQGSGPVGP